MIRFSVAARPFLDCFEVEVTNIHGVWDAALTKPVAANGGSRRRGPIRAAAIR
jgi:hypothetical protein